MTHCSITGGKILSCCYCGVQSTFLPGGKQQHRQQGRVVAALVCGSCGAPLAAQKARPLSPGKGAALPVSPATAGKLKPRKSKSYPKGQNGFEARSKPSKVKPRKKRKTLFQKLMSEAVDLVEDIFD